MEKGIEWTNPFTGLVIKAAGSSQADKHPINDERVEQLTITFEDDPVTKALFVLLRDTGARLAEGAGLSVTDCNLEEEFIHITSMPFSPEAQALILPLMIGEDLEALLFSKYAQLCGKDCPSRMLMKRFHGMHTS